MFQVFFLCSFLLERLLQRRLKLNHQGQRESFLSEVEFLGARPCSVSSPTPAPPSMGAVLCYAEGRKADRFSGFTTPTPAVNLLVQKISRRTEAYKSEKCFIKFLMVSEFCCWPATPLEYFQLCLKIRFRDIAGAFCVGFMEYLHIV